MIQKESIEDRRPLDVKISSYDATDDVHKFLLNKLKGRPPSLNQNEPSLCGNYVAARGHLLMSHLRGYLGQNIRKYLRRNRFKTPSATSARALTLSDHLRLIKQQKEALDFYQGNCVSHDELQNEFKAEGIIPLMAAHYQPEATSFPEGGEFNNHIDIALSLKSLNVKSKILYKEHVGSLLYFAPIIGATRVGMSRSVRYYEQLLDLGCKFVPFDYMLNAQPQTGTKYLPITITGTISIERSLFGLSTIYSGNPWYKGLPGTVSISSLNSFHDFAESHAGFSQVIQDEAIDFLCNILNNKTIINRQGLGSGRPANDEYSVGQFTREIQQLTEYLIE
jgi:hypothetical protein